MNYSQAQTYLAEVQERGAKLTIDNIQTIIDNLPYDLNKIQFIQVAGTNGKGSTSHFLTSILQAAGYTVGLFTSPHYQDIRERVTIDKEWISEDDFASSLTRVRDISESLVESGKIDNMPTFFEHIFLTAIDYFHRNGANFAVMEVGLGGRLDATSTLLPVASIITNISFDHTKTLGKRIQDIALEKAGIIKPGVPLICGCSVKSIANTVIKRECLSKQAPFFNVINSQNRLSVQEESDHYHCQYSTPLGEYSYDVTVNGRHQTQNAATAVKTMEVLNSRGLGISPHALYEGIKNNFIPGRVEMIAGDPPYILDGSHNEESVRALTEFLKQKNLKDLTLIFGVLRDKKYRRMIAHLLPHVKNIVLTEPKSKRAFSAQRLVPYFNGHTVTIKTDYREALECARAFSNPVLITGSIYLSGEMRNLIMGGKHERG